MASSAMRVTVVLSKYEKTAKVLQGLNAAAPFLKHIPGADMLFPGGQSDADKVVDALNAVATRLEAGMKKIQEAVETLTHVTMWMENSSKLLGWQSRILERADELASLKQGLPSGLTEEAAIEAVLIGELLGEDIAGPTVAIDMTRTPVRAWCEGKEGVLEELGGLLEELDVWLKNAVTGAPNPVDQWETLVNAGVVARVFGLTEETSFSQMHLWYDSVFTIVQTATFVRNAALALYNRLDDANHVYENCNAVLDRLGTVDNGRWKLFGDKFVAYLKKTVADDHIGNVVARQSWQNPAHTQRVLNDAHDDDYMLADPGWQTHVEDNSYFAGLKFECIERLGKRLWYPAGTKVTINADGTTTVASGFSNPRQDVLAGLFGDKRLRESMYSLKTHGHFLTGYVDEPKRSELTSEQIANNATFVINGFRVWKESNIWGIELRYALMQIIAGKTVISNWDRQCRRPTGANVFSNFLYPRDVWIIDEAEAETGSLMPMTNATFKQMNEHITIQARFGWDAYRTAMYQPLSLKAFSPPTLLEQMLSPMPAAT